MTGARSAVCGEPREPGGGAAVKPELLPHTHACTNKHTHRADGHVGRWEVDPPGGQRTGVPRFFSLIGIKSHLKNH